MKCISFRQNLLNGWQVTGPAVGERPPYARRVVISAAPGIPLLGPSGASAHVRGIAEALRATVVTPRFVDHRGMAGATSAPALATGVAGWPSWLPTYREQAEVFTSRRCARAASELAPDLVYERHSLFSDAGWKLHSSGARWILEVNAPLVEERARAGELRDRKFAERWEREVLLAAPEIVAVSAWLVNWLRSLGCQNVRHLPNGVQPWSGNRDETRARLGLSDKFVLGFLGSMKPWHGVERLPGLLDALPGAVMLMVGNGPTKVVHPGMIHMGQVSEAEAANLVAAMDVGLAPYGPDAPPWFCPLKVLAYRAQGTPVVASDLGDCRALIGNSGTLLPCTATAAELAEACSHQRNLDRPAKFLRSWQAVADEALTLPRSAPR